MIRRLISMRHALRAEAVFAATMMAASSLGFVKAFSLAFGLPEAEFGLYITAIGIATIGGILSSMGRVEATIKYYPKLYLRGEFDQILHHAVRTLGWVSLRILLMAGLLVAALLAFGQTDLWGYSFVDILAIVLLSCVISGLSVAASVIRAMVKVKVLQIFTILRGAVPLIVAVPAALAFGWQAAIWGEIVAQVVVLIGTYLRLSRHQPSEQPHPDEPVTTDKKGGRVLYSATLIAAAVPYGGRSTVLALSGPTMAGAFGLITLLVQVGQMLAGAISQKLGPQLIRDFSLGEFHPRRVFGAMVLMLALSIGSLLVFAVSWAVPEARAFWQGYGFDFVILVIVAVNLLMPVHFFFQFAMIALNRETTLLYSACGATVICYAGFWLSAVSDLGLIGYALSLLAADTFQAVFLGAAFLGSRRKWMREGASTSGVSVK